MLKICSKPFAASIQGERVLGKSKSQSGLGTMQA